MAQATHEISIWRAGRGMPRRFGLLLDAFAQTFVDAIPYADEQRVAQLQQLASRGTLVYVHRSRNPVDYLVLSRALPRRQLPLAGFVGGLRVGIFHPLARLLRWRLPANAPDDAVEREAFLLQECIRRGESALIFLKRPLTLTNLRPTHRADYVRALIELQRDPGKSLTRDQRERPIYLVPQLLVFSQHPGRFTPTLGDTIFGTPDQPGTLRSLLRLVRQRSQARLLVGEPVDLAQLVADNRGLSDAALAKKVRWLLLQYLAREERVYSGPPLKAPARMRLETLRDRPLGHTLDRLTQTSGESRAQLARRAQRCYDEIAARFDINVVNVLDALLSWVFARIYDGIVVDDADVERIRSAMRRSPVVLIPSHRSHVDYLVLSQLLAHRGMIPPHIAAGVNLSFWPLGSIFRRCGAFFLRRSFKGDALYTAVFRAYIKRLMREGFAQEFFIEGTRSRTGKSLPPRYGVLGFEVDAFLESPQPDLQLVPIAISYEKVIEEREYERELAGGSKERESVAGLLKVTGVLRSRYGRVYVTVGEPISLRDYFAHRGVAPDQHTPEERRDTVHALGHEIVSRIDRAVPVNPTALAATALLGHHGRALPHRLLVTYAERMIEHIQAVTAGQARLSAALSDLDAAMRTAMSRLLDEGLVTSESAGGEVYYRLVDGRRVRLDHYKNSILHFFAAEAIFATVLDACTIGTKPTPLSVVRTRSLELARILEAEFIYSPDGGFAAALDAAVSRAESNGYVMLGDGRVAVPTDPLARGLHRFVANLIANIIECYWVVTRTAAARCSSPISRRELISDMRDALRSAFLSGEIFYEEANSKALVENAVSWLEDLGALVVDAKGSALRFGQDWDPARLIALADDLSHSLPK